MDCFQNDTCPDQRCNRPGTAPGFDEDDINAERTYWEPSIAPGGLVSPEMVKIKVRSICLEAFTSYLVAEPPLRLCGS